MIETLTEQRRSEALAREADDDDTEWRKKRWSQAGSLVKVEVSEGTDSATGPPSEAFGELDRRTVKSVTISDDFPEFEEKLVVEFRKGTLGDGYGVKIKVESASPGWAKQCLAQLSDEIEKSVPKWGFVLTPAGNAALLFAVYTVVLTFIVLVGAKHIHHDLGNFVAGSAVILTIPVGIFTIISTMFLPKIFPRFEVYGEGGTSTGGRRWVAFIALLITIPLGVLINLIS